MTEKIKSEREIAAMRQAGKIVGLVLSSLVAAVKPGLTTKEFDVIAENEVKRLGAIPSFKNYRGYPASVCVSINDEIVHGIPGNRVVKEGDIVSLDFGAIYEGYHGDAARTVGAGAVSLKAEALMQATEGAFRAGIAQAREGKCLGDVSAAIQRYAEARGFAVVREYTGHGIGQKLHEDPLIPNFGVAGTGLVLKRGMTLAVEPMLNIGGWQTRLGSNGWTVSTLDGSLSAHFENTIAITEGDPEILTAL
jgi:methionyl aminopeptidase